MIAPITIARAITTLPSVIASALDDVGIYTYTYHDDQDQVCGEEGLQFLCCCANIIRNNTGCCYCCNEDNHSKQTDELRYQKMVGRMVFAKQTAQCVEADCQEECAAKVFSC